ncbi:MAG: methyltransferase domain-containing protein [Rhizobiales bacterium]|nr:methyltransferase domain-containing protein [Hyphomicrobiales bacterium]
MATPDQDPPRFFDRALLRRRQRRAQALGAETFLFDRVAADMDERLGAVVRKFDHGADIGSPGAAVMQVLRARADKAEAIALPDSDSEPLPLAREAFDLAVSVLALQAVNDLPGTLAQIRRALKPDGYFLAAMAGGDTLTELRQAFAAAEAEIEGGLSPRVAHVFALMQDLRRMGATNILSERRRAPLRRATLARMAEIYAARFADADGRVRATFDIVWLAGWAPDDSQPKPLKPGSAKMSLEEAVKKAGGAK